MKFFAPFAVTLLLGIAPCSADIKSSLFRDTYACAERGPSSVCIYGTIPRGKQVTLLAKGWKSSAQPKEQFSNDSEGFQNGVKTSTRLQVTKPPPKDVSMIAVLAPAEAVNELPLDEVQDEALIGRISQYIKKADGLNLYPDIRLLKTRLLKLSPTILLSETFLSPPEHVADLEKQLSTGCGGCENVPLLIGPNLEDLFKETRSKTVNVEHTCGGINFAFAAAGRTYVASHAFTCESDSFSATLIHDLSGQKPKLVFQLSGGL
jgi:hypothetical protein